MKNYKLLLVAFCLLSSSAIIAQDTSADNKPVRSPWETSTIVDFATPQNLAKGAIELMIHHRFGKFDNGFTDLYGIYSKLSVGFGTEKNNKMQEFRLKWNILQQTRSGSMPVDITYFGNVVIDGRDEGVFGGQYEFTNRLSYFHELIVSRKFTDKLSALAGFSYSHFNSVEHLYRHELLALHFGGRYKLWNSNSFIFEYNHPLEYDLTKHADTEGLEDMPPAGLSAGIEFATSTHCFQIFCSNYENIIPQKNICFNTNDFADSEFVLGFNITVRF